MANRTEYSVSIRNFLINSVEIEEWRDAFGALDALLNMNSKVKVDERVLEIMLSEVIASKDEVLVARLAQLMARLTHRQSLNSRVSLFLAG